MYNEPLKVGHSDLIMECDTSTSHVVHKCNGW